MSISLENLMECLESGLEYLPITAKLVVVSYLIGVVFGLVIALIRIYRVPAVSQLMAAFITIWRGIPSMVALLLFYIIYLLKFDQLAVALHLPFRVNTMNQIVVAYFVLSIGSATTLSETFRGALKGIDKTQYEAAYSIGLTRRQALTRIILPQMFPIAIPAMINNLVGTIKGTSLVLAIGIVEVTAGAIIPCGITYSFTEGYIAAALIYWGFSFVLEMLAKRTERRLNKYRRGVA